MSSTYVEIFHSKPSWSLAYIQRLLSPTPPSWASVSPSDALTDASHIREKFRVHRLDLRSLPGQTLRFTVTNGTLRDWDGPPDNPAGWFEISAGGRYVVEHGMRRVGDVGEECVRLLEHPLDTWVEVAFVAELWERCFFAFQRDGEDWVPKPGVEMTLVKGAGERRFEVAVRAKGCTFAFNNGKVGDEEVWDSNHGQNVRFIIH